MAEIENQEAVLEPTPVVDNKDMSHPLKIKNSKIKKMKAKAKKDVQEAKKKDKSMKQILREKRKLEERKSKFTTEDQYSRLEKYDLEDAQDADNIAFLADEKFKGPTPYRKIKDRPWIIVFIVLNLGLAATAYLAISNGDLNRLTTGYDFRSVLCGVDNFADKPYLYFINPVIDVNIGMCVSHCPKTTGDTICLYKKDGVTPTSFCYVQMQTTYGGKYCYPIEPINHYIVDTYLNSFYFTIRRTIADFFISKEVIAYGVILAIVIPLLILFLLKRQKTVAIVAWGSIFGTFVVIGGLAYMFWEEYQKNLYMSCPFSDNSNCAGWKPQLYKTMFIIIVFLGGVYLITILKLLGRISLAIGILKAASKTTEVLSQLRIIPIVMTIIGLSFGSLTVFVTLKSFGCGDVQVISSKDIDGGEVKTIIWSAYIQWLIIYNILMLLYWLLAILNYSDLITSYALSIWFFVKNKDTVDIPVKRSFRDITKYHLGTLFFGSWANTVFGVPKMIMGFVVKTLKKAKQHSNSIRCLTATCMCCIHVYQKLLRFISKNALVQTSLWGDDYYHSAKKSYFLLFRNAHLTKDLDYLQSFLILQTKLCVCFISSACVYAYLKFFDKSYIFQESLQDLESPFAPSILIFIIAFFLSSIIQGSFDITSKTIIQCYLIDCEMFIGEQRYAEKFIRDFMEFFVKSSENKIFVASKEKSDKDPNSTKKDVSDSIESSQNNEENDKEAAEEEEDEEEEDEDDEDEEEDDEEEDEEDDDEDEEEEGNSENSEDAEDDEKQNREADLENRSDAKKNEKFVQDAPDENVEFYDKQINGEDQDDEEQDSNEGEEHNDKKEGINLNIPDSNNLLNNPLNSNDNNFNNNIMMKNQVNSPNILNNIPMSNSMKNQINNPNASRTLNQFGGPGMPQFTEKGVNINQENKISTNWFEPNGNSPDKMNLAGNMINPSINMNHQLINVNNGSDEGTPLKLAEPEEWKLVNLNNQSYDNIKSQVFNVMGRKEEKSFNFFDKSQINDTTWKFEDPFDMQPSKNYRPY